MKRKGSPIADPKVNKFPKKDTEEKQQVVIQWLRQNYYLGCGGSTPKAQLFQEYLNMCKAENIEATSNSAFGKLVRTAFPGVQSSRKGPRGAAKHQYKNLLPRSEGVSMQVAEQDDDFEEEVEEMSSSSSSTTTPSYGSSSPVSSPAQLPHLHFQPSGPISVDSSFYFSPCTAPGPAPSSPLSSAADESEPIVSASSSPAYAPQALAHASYSPNTSVCCAQCQPQQYYPSTAVYPVHHHHHQELSSDGYSSSFDDVAALYDSTHPTTAPAELSTWEGDDVVSLFSLPNSSFPDSSSSFSVRGFVSTLGDSVDFTALEMAAFGEGVEGNRRREEEAQLMWCASGPGLEDILSTGKGDEWISTLLKGCN